MVDRILRRLARISRPAAQANVPGDAWLLGHGARFWALLVPVALLSGAFGLGLKLLLRVVEHMVWHYRTGEMTDSVARVGAVHRVVVLAVAGLMAGTIWWAMKRFTGTTGGGMNGQIWSRQGDMAVGQTLVSAALTMTIIAMGASIGREQPPKEGAAALAGVLAKRVGLTREERCLLMACAAGGGWAAVYNIPFAGGIFVGEVLIGSLALPVLVPALCTSVLATLVAWTTTPVHPYYLGIPAYPTSTSLLVWAVVAGPLLGLLAMGFVWLLGFANVHRARGNRVLVAPLVVFAALGALAIPFPELLGNGRDIGEELFLGGLGAGLIVALLVLKPLVTAWCWGSGASGGMFTPTSAYGALAGALLGYLWSLAWPGVPVGAYALVGTCAVLAAGLAAPLSAVLLMIELTAHLTSLLVPVLLAVGGASLVARALGGGSVYSVRLPLDQDPSTWRGSGRWDVDRIAGRRLLRATGDPVGEEPTAGTTGHPVDVATNPAGPGRHADPADPAAGPARRAEPVDPP